MTEPSAEEIATALEEVAVRATEQAMATWGYVLLRVRDCHTAMTWREIRVLLEKSHPPTEIDACLALAEKDQQP